MAREIDVRRDFNRRRWVPIFIFVLGFFVFLPSIWSESSVTERDEFFISFRTPIEMHEHGAWLTPWLDRQPRFRKPPLLYWATLANYEIFGMTLAAARIWGVLAGAGLAMCASLLAREIFRTTGLLAGLLTLGSIGVAVEARQAMLDLPVAFFSLLSVLCWLRWMSHQRWHHIILSALALGAAFLVKGPVGFFFFMVGAISALWMFNGWRIIRRQPIHLAVWFVLLLAICLPWPMWMRHVWGDRFTHTVDEELGARHFIEWAFLRPITTISGLLGLIFPWTPLLIGAIASYFQKIRHGSQRSQTWLLVWCVASTLPFFFMKASERYLLGIAPVECVLIAAWLEDGDSVVRRWLFRLCVVLLALIALALCAAVIWLKLGIVGPVLCVAAVVWMLWQARRITSYLRITFGGVIAMALCLGVVYPQLGINAMPLDLEQKLGGLPAVHFINVHPCLLSMRLGYSVQKFDDYSFPAEMAAHPNGMAVFLTPYERGKFEAMLVSSNLQSTELFHYGTVAALKTYFGNNKFDRANRREAIATRSIEPLQLQVFCFKVMPGPPKN
ncbi:MAG TPA: phospholipid carrier-dependent glycosyltransferase [Verrucomicrobiae bacterium]|nr:phospholipid carrier-dependent glycosyltransferase [Verrucomicrobiae bacterium]